MTPRTAAMIGAGLIGGALLLRTLADQQAQVLAEEAAPGEGGEPLLDYLNPIGMIENQIDSYATEQAQRDGNARAFLAMISKAEGTDRRANPYAVCYGYRFTITDFSDHPAELGVWKGEPLDSLGPAYVGKRSTAAGRHQIILPTWRMCKRALSLPDFGPDSQDKAALYLIKKRGALDDVEAGRIPEAIEKCRAEWASLPGAGYGQPERPLLALLDAYTAAGGYLA